MHVSGDQAVTDSADLQRLPSTRRHRGQKLFALTLDRALGPRVHQDGIAAVELWSALTGADWQGPDGSVVSYSLRSAGELVAWIREEGDYLDWYCCGPIVCWPTGSTRLLHKKGGQYALRRRRGHPPQVDTPVRSGDRLSKAAETCPWFHRGLTTVALVLPT